MGERDEEVEPERAQFDAGTRATSCEVSRRGKTLNFSQYFSYIGWKRAGDKTRGKGEDAIDGIRLENARRSSYCLDIIVGSESFEKSIGSIRC